MRLADIVARFPVRIIMIGVLDSGIGGLVSVRTIIDNFPDMDILYVGDTARTPYNCKSRDTVRKFSLECLDFLKSQKIQLLVITCYHISAAAKDIIAEQAGVPTLNAVTAAARCAGAEAKLSAIGILEDRCWNEEEEDDDETEIRQFVPYTAIYKAACPLLSPLIQYGRPRKPEGIKIIKNYVRPLKTKQIDTLILGSPLFSLIKEQIQQKAGKRVRVIDPSTAIVIELRRFMEKNPAFNNINTGSSIRQFCVTDLNRGISATAQKIFGRNLKLESIFK